jgi:hypothetical protein
MFLLILLIIALYSLFAFLCYWHYNLVKSSEVKGDKENLCKIVRIVLICSAVSVFVSTMIGATHWIVWAYNWGYLIDSSIRYITRNLFFFCVPLLAIGVYIWMIVKEMLQIKKKSLNLFLSLVLIPVFGFSLWCIGIFMCMAGYHG